MPKEILIYDDFDRWTAERIVKQISELDSDFSIRLNTNGGSVIDTYAILNKLSEVEGGDTVHVDGRAFSMGAFFLPFFKNRIGHNASQYMMHKAAYPSWYEPTTEEQERLLEMNNLLKAQMQAAGIKSELIERVFKSDVREDVFLTAQEALEAGLLTEIRELKVSERKSLQAKFYAEMAAHYSEIPQAKQEKINTPNIMNLQELQAKYPELYAKAKADGVNAERKRVTDLLGFVKAEENTSRARAIKAIKDGEDVGSITAEMVLLLNAEARTTSMEEENLPPVGEDPKGSAPTDDSKRGVEAKKQAAQDQVDEIVALTKKL